MSFPEHYENVLFIDKHLVNFEIIVNSVNSSTFPVVYSSSSSKTEISTLLQNVHFSRIGFCFNSSLVNSKMFLDEQLLFDDSYQNQNVLFVLDLIKKFNITNIDFLACDTLKYANWQKYFSILTDAGVIVGASNDKTGNVEYGGNWIMESTGENIESVYFTENIRKYPHLLDFWATSEQGLNGFLFEMASDGNYIYAIMNLDNIVRININDTSVFSTTWTPNNGVILGIFNIKSDNTYLYGVNGDGSIIRINLSTGLRERPYPAVYSKNFRVFFVDNVYFYYITGINNEWEYSQKLQKIKKSDGSVTLICNLPDTSDTSIVRPLGDMQVYDGFVYLLDQVAIHRVNLTTNVIDYNWVTVSNGIGMKTFTRSENYFYIMTSTEEICRLNIKTKEIILKYYTVTINGINKHTVLYDNYNLYVGYRNNDLTLGYISRFELPRPACFKEGSKILTVEGYKPIEFLKKGDLVQTLKHGLLPIDMIGKRVIYHSASKDRVKEQLYKCSSAQFEIWEDLVLTGCHSILVDELSETQKEDSIKINGNIYVTDGKYRLPACVDERTSVYEIPGSYTIYHLALENEDYYMNYGIYANGLLVETSSKRYMKELSDMDLIE